MPNSVYIAKTELGIKCPLIRISPLFHNFSATYSLVSLFCSLIPGKLKILIFPFTSLVTFCNMIMSTGPSVATALQERMTLGVPAYKPRNQLHTESKVAIMLQLHLCFTHYTALQICKKLLCLNPVAKESAGCPPIINPALKSQ